MTSFGANLGFGRESKKLLENCLKNTQSVNPLFKYAHDNAPDLFREYFIKSSHGLDLLIPKVRTKSQDKAGKTFFILEHKLLINLRSAFERSSIIIGFENDA